MAPDAQICCVETGTGSTADLLCGSRHANLLCGFRHRVDSRSAVWLPTQPEHEKLDTYIDVQAYRKSAVRLPTQRQHEKLDTYIDVRELSQIQGGARVMPAKTIPILAQLCTYCIHSIHIYSLRESLVARGLRGGGSALRCAWPYGVRTLMSYVRHVQVTYESLAAGLTRDLRGSVSAQAQDAKEWSEMQKGNRT